MGNYPLVGSREGTDSKPLEMDENISSLMQEKAVNDLSFAQPKLCREDSQETRHLKELLLLHLDLIQHQQETIAARDAKIKALTQERNSLRCHLERAERRVAVMRQNSSASKPRTDKSFSDKESTPAPKTETPNSFKTKTETPSPVKSKAELSSKSCKRQGSLLPQSFTKKLRNEADSDSESPNRTRKDLRPKLTSHRWQIREQDEKLQHLKQINKQNFVTPVCLKTKQDRLQNRSDVALHFDKPRSLHIGGVRDSTIERTAQMYPVKMCVSNAVPSELELPKSSDVTDRGVEVPKWRIVQIPRGYQMEGTENLDDEIYMKRHQKPETEEKRRKRWDLQRVREERQRDRLLQQGTSTDTSNQNTLTSFLPNPYDALYLEVKDTVPVSAFGHPVPSLPREEFTLPWFNWEKREKEEKNRSCRKRRL